MELSGKVAVITGGVSGIGLGFAKALLASGARVVVTYMRESQRDLAMTALEAHRACVRAIQLDVTDRSGMKRVADEVEGVFGNIHILCNNAGVNMFGLVDGATFDDWDWILGVNLMGVVNGLVTFLPRIKAHGEGGHVVNVASMAGLLPGPAVGVYSVSKFAVWGLSESLRPALAPHGVGVSIFFPGLVNTQIHESARNRPAHLGESSTPADPRIEDKWRELQALGIDPDSAGKLLISAVRNNEHYVFSHPELRDRLHGYFNGILSAMSASAQSQRRQRSSAAGFERELYERMQTIMSLCVSDESQEP